MIFGFPFFGLFAKHTPHYLFIYSHIHILLELSCLFARQVMFMSSAWLMEAG